MKIDDKQLKLLVEGSTPPETVVKELLKKKPSGKLLDKIVVQLCKTPNETERLRSFIPAIERQVSLERKKIKKKTFDSIQAGIAVRKILSKDILELALGQSQAVASDQVTAKVNDIYNKIIKNPTQLISEIAKMPNRSRKIVSLKNIETSIVKHKKKIDILVPGEILGAGGFKEAQKVYSLIDRISKVIQYSISNDPRKEINKNLKHEYKISKKFEKTNINHVIRLKQVKDLETKKMINITSLCEEGDLLTFLSKRNVAEQEKTRLLLSAANALAKIHRAGICHLDVKPENIFITREKNNRFDVRIGDYGLCQAMKGRVKSNVGTPMYIAPELVGKGKSLKSNGKIDVFSFGITMYGVLTNKHTPFEWSYGQQHVPQASKTQQSLVQLQLRSHNNLMMDLIADCVQKNPDRRPSMQTVADRLSHLC